MRALLLVGCGLVTLATFGADVTSYFVSKGNAYTQTDSGAPQLNVSPWIFHARVAAPRAGVIQNASLSYPPGPAPMFADGLTPRTTNWWSIVRAFSTEGGFNPFFRDTNWALVIQSSNDGVTTNVLPLFVSSYPAAPHVANHPAAQNINPASNFTLFWDAIPGATAGDLISLTLFHRKTANAVVYQSSTRLGDAGTIPGNATSTVIPAGTLEPGRVYLARLRVDQIIATNLTNYPGATGFVSSFASTDFYIKTAGATDDTAPRIVYVSPAEGAVTVSTMTPITWAFSKPMLTNSFSYSLPALGFRRTHSPDRFLITLTPTNGTYASTTQIRWKLNTWDDSISLADTDGNPLLPDRYGTFLTGTTTNLPPGPAAPFFTNNAARPGEFSTTIRSVPERSYLLLGSTNLTNWAYATVITSTGDSVSIATNSSGPSLQFYRAIALP